MVFMKVKWTLNYKQLLGVAVYSAILPASLLAVPFVGSWVLSAGAIISLPLAPIGFVIFWGALAKGKVFAFAVTWAVNFFQAWLMLAQYVARKNKKALAVLNASTP